MGDDETLGPCGCTDYHMADCEVMTRAYPEYADYRDADDEEDDYPREGDDDYGY